MSCVSGSYTQSASSIPFGVIDTTNQGRCSGLLHRFLNDANGRAEYLISHVRSPAQLAQFLVRGLIDRSLQELLHSGIVQDGKADMALAHVSRARAGGAASLVFVPFLTLESKRAGGSFTEATDQSNFATGDIYTWLRSRGFDSKLWVGLNFEFVEAQRVGDGMRWVAPS
jgi:hypothetical protein